MKSLYGIQLYKEENHIFCQKPIHNCKDIQFFVDKVPVLKNVNVQQPQCCYTPTVQYNDNCYITPTLQLKISRQLYINNLPDVICRKFQNMTSLQLSLCVFSPSDHLEYYNKFSSQRCLLLSFCVTIQRHFLSKNVASYIDCFCMFIFYNAKQQ